MQKSLRYGVSNRDGAIIPLFAILIPVLLVLAAFSVNLARMQLTTTELRIVTDVTSHAGGRALNVFQNMDNPTSERVIDKLQETVDRYYAMNTVAGQTLTPPSDPTSYIQFYNLGNRTDRLDEVFHNQNIVSYSDARGGTAFNGVGVQANVDTDYLFDFKYGGGSLGTFAPTRNSITKQIERDLAIVIDRSSSMVLFKERDDMRAVLDDMLAENYINETEYRIAYGYQQARVNSSGTHYFDDRGGTNIMRPRYRVSFPHSQEDIDGKRVEVQSLDVIGEMQQFAADHPGDQRDIPAMLNYMKSWEGVAPYTGNRKSPFDHSDWQAAGRWNHAPAESRWDYLFRGINDFIDVLELTPAEEKISLVAFSSEAEALVRLTDNYQGVLDAVEKIIPQGSTFIDKGLTEGLELVFEAGVTRPFAEKIIVVMTDGINRGGSRVVVNEAERIVNEVEANNEVITIHTLTFGDGTGITPNPNYPNSSDRRWDGEMVEVAIIGNGEHFHAEEAEELQPKLKQIANIQPTIFTF